MLVVPIRGQICTLVPLRVLKSKTTTVRIVAVFFLEMFKQVTAYNNPVCVESTVLRSNR